MRSTPAIPAWIRDFRHPGYTSIYEMRPEEAKLYCTETLLGDWDGSVLLLAKDAAPAEVIDDRIRRGEADPWRHSERGRDRMGWRTNEKVIELASLLPGEKLYGSALGHLMQDGEETSTDLSGVGSGPLRAHLDSVLRFVLSEMDSLRAIVCLGNHSWDLVSSMYAPRSKSGGELGARVDVDLGGRPGSIFRLYHPSRAFTGGWAARRAEWGRAGDALARIGQP